MSDDSSTGSPVHVLMLSIQALCGLPRLHAPGIVPCIISFSSQLPCFLTVWPQYASFKCQFIIIFINQSTADLLSGLSRFTPPDLLSFTDLCREADNNLFDSVLNNSHHILRHFPPPSQASQHYSLRSRRHKLQLSIGPTSLSDRNFLHRMLYSDSCWHIFTIHCTCTTLRFANGF